MRAVIPARRSWPILLFLLVWLGGWMVGGSMAMAQVLRPQANESRAFLAFWLIGWAIGACWVFIVLLWQLAGREILSLEPGTLLHRVEAFGVGRSRAYDTSRVERFRAAEFAVSPFSNQASWMPPVFGAGMGRIAFDYGARTVRLGPGLDEAEARSLVATLAEHLPRSARTD